MMDNSHDTKYDSSTSGESYCTHYGYGPDPDIIATRTYCSGRLQTYTSPSKVSEKTAAFPGDSAFVEGREASPSVGSEKIIWSWSEEDEAKASTNYYTVFSMRLFGDLDFDNDVDAVDRAAVTNLTEQYGWPILVASNTLRKVELKTDVLIPGYKILRLFGDANIRIWTTPNPTINDIPLLITGQTVTNGIDGASFGVDASSMLYVEALDSGVATLTYSYVGTGAAEGFGCSAALGITAVNVELEPVTTETNAQGLILNPCGVATGGLAMYHVSIEPVDAVPDADIHWNVVSGGVTFYSGHDTGREAIIQGGASESEFKLEVQIAGLSESCRPYIHGRVLIPRTVQIRAYVICDSNGVEAVSENTVTGWIDEANRIYRQVAVTFTLAEVQNIYGKDNWFVISDSTEFAQMCSYANNTGGLELYCVNHITWAVGLHSDMRLALGDPRRGIAVRADADLTTLAHEIGHACGLSDMYKYDAGDGLVSLEKTRPLNWSGGDGTGYYSSALAYRDLTYRVLMDNHNNTDIPLDYLTRMLESFRTPISVGLNSMGSREPLH